MEGVSIILTALDTPLAFFALARSGFKHSRSRARHGRWTALQGVTVVFLEESTAVSELCPRAVAK